VRNVSQSCPQLRHRVVKARVKGPVALLAANIGLCLVQLREVGRVHVEVPAALRQLLLGRQQLVQLEALVHDVLHALLAELLVALVLRRVLRLVGVPVVSEAPHVLLELGDVRVYGGAHFIDGLGDDVLVGRHRVHQVHPAGLGQRNVDAGASRLPQQPLQLVLFGELGLHLGQLLLELCVRLVGETHLLERVRLPLDDARREHDELVHLRQTLLRRAAEGAQQGLLEPVRVILDGGLDGRGGDLDAVDADLVLDLRDLAQSLLAHLQALLPVPNRADKEADERVQVPRAVEPAHTDDDLVAELLAHLRQLGKDVHRLDVHLRHRVAVAARHVGEERAAADALEPVGSTRTP